MNNTKCNRRGAGQGWKWWHILPFFVFAGNVAAAEDVQIMEYKDFGPQVASHGLLGMQWYRWESSGTPHSDQKYDIKVVVYRGLSLEQVSLAYPTDRHQGRDYRYVSCGCAIEYLRKTIAENVIPEVTSTLEETKKKLRNTCYPDK